MIWLILPSSVFSRSVRGYERTSNGRRHRLTNLLDRDDFTRLHIPATNESTPSLTHQRLHSRLIHFPEIPRPEQLHQLVPCRRIPGMIINRKMHIPKLIPTRVLLFRFVINAA
jgi:hypothetical protein